MKKLLSIPLLCLLISAHGPAGAWGSESSTYNLFTQRKIVVGSLENSGDQQYAYLTESLRDQIALLIADAPFIALTDREHDFLRTLSRREEYKQMLSAAGGTIGYRLEPVVIKGEPVAAEYPLHVYGRYEVYTPEEAETPVLRISLSVRNLMTDTEDAVIDLEGSLFGFIDAPRSFLIPILPEFLRYTVYRVTLTAEPSEALIFLDDQLIGIGEAADVLVTPGLHRLAVREDGYHAYRDLVQITADGFSRHIRLQKELCLTRYDITTTPDGVNVYLDEEFQGYTPLSLSVGPGNRTITLSKEGYRTETLVVTDLPEGGGKLNFGLIEAGVSEQLKQKAERHRKRGMYLSWAGLGVLGSSIFFGVMSTLKAQESDLYQTSDPGRSSDARTASETYSILLYSSLAAAGGIFVFSFVETVQYFTTYNRIAEYEQIPLVSTELAF